MTLRRRRVVAEGFDAADNDEAVGVSSSAIAPSFLAAAHQKCAHRCALARCEREEATEAARSSGRGGAEKGLAGIISLFSRLVVLSSAECTPLPSSNCSSEGLSHRVSARRHRVLFGDSRREWGGRERNKERNVKHQQCLTSTSREKTLFSSRTHKKTDNQRAHSLPPFLLPDSSFCNERMLA